MTDDKKTVNRTEKRGNNKTFSKMRCKICQKLFYQHKGQKTEYKVVEEGVDMKKLFKSTTINDEVLEKIGEVNGKEISLDEKRCLVLESLENYYKAGEGRKKNSEELIQRLSEIEKNCGFKEMIWAAILGVLFAIFTEGLFLLGRNIAMAVDFGRLTILTLIAFILVLILVLFLFWGIKTIAEDCYGASEYDQMHLENEEKALIEGILKERFEKAHAAYAAKKVHVRKEPLSNDQKSN